MNKFSKRERVLIYIMSCFIIAFVFGFLLILPARKAYNKADERKGNLQVEKQTKQYEISDLENREKQLSSLLDEINSLKGNFYPEMTNDQVEYLVSNLMLKYSLKPQSLAIAEVKPKDSSSSQTDSTSSKDTSKTDSTSNSDSSSSTTANTAILKKISISVKLTGEPNNINLFLNDITGNPKMILAGYKLTQGTDGSSLDLEIQINMLKNIE